MLRVITARIARAVGNLPRCVAHYSLVYYLRTQYVEYNVYYRSDAFLEEAMGLVPAVRDDKSLESAMALMQVFFIYVCCVWCVWIECSCVVVIIESRIVGIIFSID